MKKICAFLTASLLLVAGAAFADTVAEGKIISASNADSSYTLGPPNAFAKLSTGVSLGYATGTGTYAIATKHKNGDKEYGAAANDGKNYVHSADVGAAAGSLSVSDSSAFQGWETL